MNARRNSEQQPPGARRSISPPQVDATPKYRRCVGPKRARGRYDPETRSPSSEGKCWPLQVVVPGCEGSSRLTALVGIPASATREERPWDGRRIVDWPDRVSPSGRRLGMKSRRPQIGAAAETGFVSAERTRRPGSRTARFNRGLGPSVVGYRFSARHRQHSKSNRRPGDVMADISDPRREPHSGGPVSTSLIRFEREMRVIGQLHHPNLRGR